MKNKLIVILIVWCVALTLGVGAYRSAYLQQKMYATSFEETITGLHTEIKKERIRLNDSISLYMAEANDLAVSKKNLEVMYGELLKASKTKSKDVGSITGVNTVIHTIDTVVCLVDSFGGVNAQLHDQWADINVNIDRDRQAIIDYSFRDSLTIMTVQKKHSILFGLIKWKEHESTKVVSHNPNAEISSLQTITIIK